MEAKIRDYRGVTRADLDVSRICLVTGPNHAGKSSCLQAVAAAAAGNVVPVPGIKKSHAGALVRTGAAKGVVYLATPDGAAQVTWPAAEYATKEKPPQASAYAAGLLSVVDLDARNRAAALVEYLRATPTREDLAAALRDAGLSDEPRPPAQAGGPAQPSAIERIWQSVTTEGWDAAHTRAKETGIKLKGRWEQTAGEKYGSAKAGTWQPDGWELDLENASEDGLRQEVAQAKEFLEAAIAAAAVDQHERAQLEAEFAKVTEYAQEVHRLDLEYQTIRAEAMQAKAGVDSLPPPTGAAAPEATVPCPHCSGPLVVSGGAVRKPGGPAWPDAAENEKRARMLDEAKAKYAPLVEKEAAAAQTLAQARTRLYEASKAEDTLKALPAPTAAGTASQVDDCREKVRLAELRLTAFQRKTSADRCHASVAMNQAVIEALAPEGVRQQRLSRMLHQFNDSLAQLCAAAGWLPVTIGGALDIEYGGRPYQLLSASEAYRVRAVLAIAMALVDGSALIILDAADVLDRGGRNGLFKLLVSLGRPALVGMTLNSPDEAPKLAERGVGQVYWITDGVAQPVGQARAAA
jgi:hypothetical protein